MIGLNQPMMEPTQPHPEGLSSLGHVPQVSSAGGLAYLTAENRDLKAEAERLRADRDRLNETQQRIMELLGTRSPERILHDLRNVLNERELFKALADTLED